MVVAVPVVAAVQSYEEEALSLRFSKQLVRVRLIRHCASQRGVDSPYDRCGEQKVAHLLGLMVHHLGDEVVGERAKASCDVLEARSRDLVAQHDGGKLQTGGPTLSAVDEQLNLTGIEIRTGL